MMLDAHTLKDDLRSLKNEVAGLVAAAGDAILENSKSQADSATEHVKAILKDLSETLESEESQIEQLIAERPVAALASAFALGIVVGLLLRRR
jgi:ElaB/YqjD/DUF883 family membrane-anchored ribosome-binding protein